MNISREFLFEEDAFFASCHASTVLPFENGAVLAAYFAGSRESADDVGIWLSRKIDGQWLAPRLIAKVEPVAHWNPVLMPFPGGARLIFKVGKRIPDWKSWTMTTLDMGETWSKPERLPPPNDACGPVRNKPLYLSDGSLLAPDSVETETEWRPRIDISYDYGASFPTISKIPLPPENARAASGVNALPACIQGKGAIQPAIWESGAGKLHVLLRTTGGYIFRSDSQDYGRSWCVAYNTGLPNNNSGIDIARLDGKLYLAFNPVSGNWSDRTPLVIMRSSDNGAAFERYITLEDAKTDPRAAAPTDNRVHTAEFSYPAIVAKAGKLHVTYTYNRRRIAYREITP